MRPATLAALRDRRSQSWRRLVALHKGRIVKLMGDGVLVEFGSAVNAVRCAVELQLNPQLFQMQAATSYAHFYTGRYVEALSWAEKALLVRPTYVTAHRVLTASCAMAGRREQASKAMARLRELDPTLRLSNLMESNPLRRPEDLDRLAKGLRKAGLPE